MAHHRNPQAQHGSLTARHHDNFPFHRPRASPETATILAKSDLRQPKENQSHSRDPTPRPHRTGSGEMRSDSPRASSTTRAAPTRTATRREPSSGVKVAAPGAPDATSIRRPSAPLAISTVPTGTCALVPSIESGHPTAAPIIHTDPLRKRASPETQVPP